MPAREDGIARDADIVAPADLPVPVHVHEHTNRVEGALIDREVLQLEREFRLKDFVANDDGGSVCVRRVLQEDVNRCAVECGRALLEDDPSAYGSWSVHEISRNVLLAVRTAVRIGAFPVSEFGASVMSDASPARL